VFAVLGNDLGLAHHGYGLVRWDPTKGVWCVGLSYIATQAVKGAGVKANESDRLRRRAIYDKLLTTCQKTSPSHICYEIYTVRENPWVDGLLRASKVVLADFELGRADVAGLWGRPKDMAAKITTATWREATREHFAEVHKWVALAGRTAGRGRAAEVLAVQGVVEALAWQVGVPLIGHQPGERQRRLLGRATGSKEEIIAAVRAGLPGYGEALVKKLGNTTTSDSASGVDISTMPVSTVENHIADAAAHAWIATVDLVRAQFGSRYDHLPGMAGVLVGHRAEKTRKDLDTEDAFE
jgi:Holliday junction resolvasome RuvABC endonuclease subunit